MKMGFMLFLERDLPFAFNASKNSDFIAKVIAG